MKKYFVVFLTPEARLKFLGEFPQVADAFEFAEHHYGCEGFDAVITENTASEWMREFNTYCEETKK